MMEEAYVHTQTYTNTHVYVYVCNICVRVYIEYYMCIYSTLHVFVICHICIHSSCIQNIYMIQVFKYVPIYTCTFLWDLCTHICYDDAEVYSLFSESSSYTEARKALLTEEAVECKL